MQKEIGMIKEDENQNSGGVAVEAPRPAQERCKECGRVIDKAVWMANAYPQTCGPCADDLAQHYNDIRP